MRRRERSAAALLVPVQSSPGLNRKQQRERAEGTRPIAHLLLYPTSYKTRHPTYSKPRHSLPLNSTQSRACKVVVAHAPPPSPPSTSSPHHYNNTMNSSRHFTLSISLPILTALALAIFISTLAPSTSAQVLPASGGTNVSSEPCGWDHQCSKDSPCCSEFGYCSSGMGCLNGCNVSVSSSVAECPLGRERAVPRPLLGLKRVLAADRFLSPPVPTLPANSLSVQLRTSIARPSPSVNQPTYVLTSKSCGALGEASRMLRLIHSVLAPEQYTFPDDSRIEHNLTAFDGDTSKWDWTIDKREHASCLHSILLSR